MVGGYSTYKTEKSDKNFSYYYKCNFAYHKRHIKSKKSCTYTRSLNERVLEKNMIEGLKKHIEAFILEKESHQKKMPLKILRASKKR